MHESIMASVPECESKDMELLGGREFVIKEIVAC